MKATLFFILLISAISFAAPINSKECQERLENKRLQLNVISSNIANVSTTRTPEGGPYNRKELLCKNRKCKTVAHAKFINKYLPDHLDADISGYVKFPDIKVEDEMSAMVAASRDYEKIVTDCK